MDFRDRFVRFFALEMLRHAPIRFACLQAVVVDPEESDFGNPRVSIDSFAKALDYFGPLEEDDPTAFMERIYEILRKPYYFGDISKEESQVILGPQRTGTFLVRLSSLSGQFCVAVKRYDGTFSHFRLGDAQMMVDTFEQFLRTPRARSRDAFFLRHACPGSRFAQLLQQFKNLGSSADLLDNSNNRNILPTAYSIDLSGHWHEKNTSSDED